MLEVDATARVRRAVHPDADVEAGVHQVREAEAGSSRSGPELLARAPDANLPTAADFFVPSLPGIPNLASHPTHPLNLYAGLLPSYPGEGFGGGFGPVGQKAKIFFMMARARRSAGKQRVILWFNGGPGCSSFDGSLMEVGPFRTVPAAQTASGQTEVKLVEGGWEEFATVIFIDQPPGTGLSTVPTEGYLTELSQGSQHLIHFLSNLYSVFPDLVGQETYLAGESYAGQYIPYFASSLLKTNKLPGFNLAGLAIGNGWIDPIRQYPAYAEFAYTKGLVQKGTDAGKALEAELAKCNEAIAKITNPELAPVNIFGCEGVMEMVRAPFRQEINGKKMCMNIYDVRLTDEEPACGMNWPPDLSDVYSFLKRKDVVQALHATDHTGDWVECNSRVGGALQNKNSAAAVHLIPGILEKGVKIMMFAGAEDLICNTVGIENMIQEMTWSGEQGLGNATTQSWSLNGTEVGEWTTGRNMTYVKVYDASHMVGFDVPDVTNDMIMRFMGVDMNEFAGSTSIVGSVVGEDDDRPEVHVGKVKPAPGIPLLKGGKGDWESWYNAISAVLILLTLGGIVALYLYLRRRRRARSGPLHLPRGGSAERDDRDERVPLATAAEDYELEESSYGRDNDSGSSKGKGKGKEKARDSESDAERGETVFALGDEDEH